jgi:hypothetical protein
MSSTAEEIAYEYYSYQVSMQHIFNQSGSLSRCRVLRFEQVSDECSADVCHNIAGYAVVS